MLGSSHINHTTYLFGRCVEDVALAHSHTDGVVNQQFEPPHLVRDRDLNVAQFYRAVAVGDLVILTVAELVVILAANVGDGCHEQTDTHQGHAVATMLGREDLRQGRKRTLHDGVVEREHMANHVVRAVLLEVTGKVLRTKDNRRSLVRVDWVLGLVEQVNQLLCRHVARLWTEDVFDIRTERTEAHSGLRWVSDGLCNTRSDTTSLAHAGTQQVRLLRQSAGQRVGCERVGVKVVAELHTRTEALVCQLPRVSVLAASRAEEQIVLVRREQVLQCVADRLHTNRRG